MSGILIKQGNQQCEADGEQLLPGIFNEIVLDHISPKLPWRVFYTLKLVSRGWHHAIQSRQVYDARVRSHSTETFIFVRYVRDEDRLHVISLWCMRDESFLWEPPQIPGLARGINHWQDSQLIVLDGRIYILGGRVHRGVCASRKVYVLDMAGQGSWKECASMLEPRRNFGCGVKDGKIYVFGGLRGSKSDIPITGAEVYDPKCDSWSAISPKSPRYYHEVAVVGEELLLYSGDIVVKEEDGFYWPQGHNFEIYHPGKDEWRELECFWLPEEQFFSAQGKLYSITDLLISAYDFDGNSWTPLHFHSYAGMEPVDFSSRGLNYLAPVESLALDHICVVAVDDELLALVMFTCDNGYSVSRLIRSQGFGSEKKEMLWQHQRDFLEGFDLRSICSIQL